MRTLKRPMFKKGGPVNTGIMTGLVDRSQHAGGGTIGGGTIQGTPMGYRTGFATFAPIGSTIGKTALTGTEGLIGQGMAAELAESPANLKAVKHAKRFAKLRNLSITGMGVTAALPLGYFALSKWLQESLPESLQSSKYGHGTTGIYDQATFPGAMAAGADVSPEVDEILRRGDVVGREDRMGSGFWDIPTIKGGGLTEEKAEQRKIERLSKKLDKEGTGGLNDIQIKETIADKRSRLNKRAKEFLDILSPEARKRALIDSAAAASEAFGQSTGDTKQDFANAITAAAKASGGSQELVLMAKKLAIQEDIERGLKKDTKDSVWREKLSDFMSAHPKKEGESEVEYRQRILSMATKSADDDWRALKLKYSNTFGPTRGPKRFVRDYYGGKKDFGGIVGEDPIEEGKKYYDPEEDRWVIFKGGEPSDTTPHGA